MQVRTDSKVSIGCHYDFGLLQSREEVARAARQLLTPLISYFTPEGSGIRFGVVTGTYGEPVASLEAFSRALWGLLPLLVGGGHFEGWERWLKGLVVGTDTSHPGYWGLPQSCDQRQVEQPAIALALTLKPDFFWEPLTFAERQRVVTWLYHTNHVDIVDSNWRWFRVLVNASLRCLGEKWSAEQLESDLRRIDEFYLGNGWYRDENRIGDYYNPMAMQYYALIYTKIAESFDPERVQTYRERGRLFAQDFGSWFNSEGAAIPWGRSLIYRAAQGSFWGALAFADVAALPWGEIKGQMLRHLRSWLAQPIFSETGLLTIGYRFPNAVVGEDYNAYGSPYWVLKAFLPLALAEDHPFWQAKEVPMRTRSSVARQPFAGLILCHDERTGHVFGLNQGQPLECWPRHCAHKYGKCVYSATFGFGVAASDQLHQIGLDGTLAVSADAGQHYVIREKCVDPVWEQDALASTWKPWPDVEIRTWLKPALPGHIRVHRIRSSRPLFSAEGGFAIDSQAEGYIERGHHGPSVIVANANMGSALVNLHGERHSVVQKHEPGFHLLWFIAAFPMFCSRHAAGESWLVTYVTGGPGNWVQNPLDFTKVEWEVQPTFLGLAVRRWGMDFFVSA